MIKEFSMQLCLVMVVYPELLWFLHVNVPQLLLIHRLFDCVPFFGYYNVVI